MNRAYNKLPWSFFFFFNLNLEWTDLNSISYGRIIFKLCLQSLIGQPWTTFWENGLGLILFLPSVCLVVNFCFPNYFKGTLWIYLQIDCFSFVSFFFIFIFFEMFFYLKIVHSFLNKRTKRRHIFRVSK